MLQIAICDDERKIVDKLEKIIREYFKDGNVIALYNFFDAKTVLNCNIIFDIIFLDIELKNHNGIDIAKELQQKSINTKIIFVTNYVQYIRSAFQVHAFQYILKPVKVKEIKDVLNECVRYIQQRNNKKLLTIETNEGIVDFDLFDIYYWEFNNRRIYIHTNQGCYHKSGTLKIIYNDLKTYGFGMPHNAYIVNYYNIRNIKGYEITMKNGDIVPLAQKRAVKFKNSFYDFLHETFYYL